MSKVSYEKVDSILKAGALNIIAARPTMGHEEIAEHISGKTIITANMRRTVDARAGHKPKLSDIMLDAGFIDMADTVVVISQPSYYDNNQPEHLCLAQIIKRNGMELFEEVDVSVRG